MEDKVITNLPSIKLIQNIHDLMTLNMDDDKLRYTQRRYFFQQINQINNIPVCVILFSQFIPDINAELKSNIYYCIVSKVIGLNHKILYRSIRYRSFDAIIDFTNCLNDLYEKLPQFRISSNKGKLYVQTNNIIDEELGGNYLLGEECSVCMEKTLTKTSCRHYLCICCWSKICDRNVLCPICRKQITSTQDAFFIEDDIDIDSSEYEGSWAYGDDDTDESEDDAEENDENIDGTYH